MLSRINSMASLNQPSALSPLSEHEATIHNFFSTAPYPQHPAPTFKHAHADPCCVKIRPQERACDPLSLGKGRVLESIKTTFKRKDKALNNYTISINTNDYTQVGPSGRREMQSALDKKFIAFENGKWVGKADQGVLRVNLPPVRGDFRVELAHRNKLGMNTDSLYQFQMRAGFTPHSAIFFQVRENGGDMMTSGGGRPPINLQLKNGKDVYITLQNENGEKLKEKIATLECGQAWYHYKVRIVWNRDHPLVQVAINGKNVFQSNMAFGAHNSKSHYSKFGIYIPHQKKQDGARYSSFLFDNVRETHRRFIAPMRSRGVRQCL